MLNMQVLDIEPVIIPKSMLVMNISIEFNDINFFLAIFIFSIKVGKLVLLRTNLPIKFLSKSVESLVISVVQTTLFIVVNKISLRLDNF